MIRSRHVSSMALDSLVMWFVTNCSVQDCKTELDQRALELLEYGDHFYEIVRKEESTRHIRQHTTRECYQFI